MPTEQTNNSSNDGDGNVVALKPKRSARDISIDERRKIVAAIDARPEGQTVLDAVNEHAIKLNQYYAWKAAIAAADDPAEDDQELETDKTVDELIEDLVIGAELDEWYETWRQRTVRLLEAESPTANTAGKILDQCMQDLAGAMGWTLESAGDE